MKFVALKDKEGQKGTIVGKEGQKGLDGKEGYNK